MSKRLTLFAGAGNLVDEVVAAALEAGFTVQVLAFTPRPPIPGVSFRRATLSRPLRVIIATRFFRSDLIAMAGAIQMNDTARRGLARFFGGRRDRRATAPSGDTAMSGLAPTLKRLTGADVVGVQTIAPGLLAQEGLIGGAPVVADMSFALQTAKAIGALDIGQAVVTCGRRVIAVEDIGGTDDLIRRVGELRARGATGDTDVPLVLAKARKPNQPDAIDLPAIGPQTMEEAAQAGIRVIVVEAGQALVVEREQMIARAGELGISVFGLRAE